MPSADTAALSVVVAGPSDFKRMPLNIYFTTCRYGDRRPDVTRVDGLIGNEQGTTAVTVKTRESLARLLRC